MPRTPLRAPLALLLLALLVACGRRDTAAPPGQPATPTAWPTFVTPDPRQILAATQTPTPAPAVTWQPAELTAMAAAGALQQTEQALSLMLTASPAAPAGYTAIALFETARAGATAAAVAPGQERTPPAGAPPDAQATRLAADQLTSVPATATRAAELGLPPPAPTAVTPPVTPAP